MDLDHLKIIRSQPHRCSRFRSTGWLSGFGYHDFYIRLQRIPTQTCMKWESIRLIHCVIARENALKHHSISMCTRAPQHDRNPRRTWLLSSAVHLGPFEMINVFKRCSLLEAFENVVHYVKKTVLTSLSYLYSI